MLIGRAPRRAALRARHARRVVEREVDDGVEGDGGLGAGVGGQQLRRGQREVGAGGVAADGDAAGEVDGEGCVGEEGGDESGGVVGGAGEARLRREAIADVGDGEAVVGGVEVGVRVVDDGVPEGEAAAVDGDEEGWGPGGVGFGGQEDADGRVGGAGVGFDEGGARAQAEEGEEVEEGGVGAEEGFEGPDAEEVEDAVGERDCR